MKLIKLISFLCFNLFLLTNSGISEASFSKSEIFKNSNECLEDSQNQSCKKLISIMEQLQLIEFGQKRFKCQSSILGLQTELVEAYFFEKVPKRRKGIMFPYVVKNC